MQTNTPNIVTQENCEEIGFISRKKLSQLINADIKLYTDLMDDQIKKSNGIRNFLAFGYEQVTVYLRTLKVTLGIKE